mmetsp:Transcript_77782/g.252032  ORF Transcript_77782/g.252032 Transcript_77782/m.252032 type:complete len:326 (-) Transcript_77782:527-1504(-)
MLRSEHETRIGAVRSEKLRGRRVAAWNNIELNAGIASQPLASFWAEACATLWRRGARHEVGELGDEDFAARAGGEARDAARGADDIGVRIGLHECCCRRRVVVQRILAHDRIGIRAPCCFHGLGVPFRCVCVRVWSEQTQGRGGAIERSSPVFACERQHDLLGVDLAGAPEHLCSLRQHGRVLEVAAEVRRFVEVEHPCVRPLHLVRRNLAQVAQRLRPARSQDLACHIEALGFRLRAPTARGRPAQARATHQRGTPEKALGSRGYAQRAYRVAATALAEQRDVSCIAAKSRHISVKPLQRDDVVVDSIHAAVARPSGVVPHGEA